jgi:myo-inositol-1(or 4)-monophosphatase
MHRIDTADQIAVKAGRLLLDLFQKRLELSSRTKGQQDIVTEADTESEKLILHELAQAFPGEKIVSEETDFDQEHSDIQLRNTWVIDPLDGTRNFAIGNPNFVVSIGYIDEKGRFSGVVYFPILDDHYVAKDENTFFNGKVTRVSSTEELRDAIVAFWDKREKDNTWNKVDILNSLRGKVKVIRVFGASALEKSWVSNDQVDLYIGNSSSIFGAVAGVALVRNAGGVALNFEGKNWKLGDIGIICGNRVLVEKALKTLV